MLLTRQIVETLRAACSGTPDDIAALVERTVKDLHEVEEQLQRAMAESGGGEIRAICPVVVDRRDQLSWSQRVLESPVVSYGWLVATDNRVLYVGQVKKPTFHAWGGVARWHQEPDAASFSFREIERVELRDAGARPRLEILAAGGERLAAEAEPAFAGALRRLGERVAHGREG